MFSLQTSGYHQSPNQSSGSSTSAVKSQAQVTSSDDKQHILLRIYEGGNVETMKNDATKYHPRLEVSAMILF
jgi:hypothetical protein